MFNILIFVIMFFSGLLVFSSKRKHLLLMLLSLEFIILSLYMLLFIYLSMYDYEFYFNMMFLVFCVCESVLGLSILVSLIRTHGNDFFFIKYIMLKFLFMMLFMIPLCFLNKSFWLIQ